ncbi:hypothetical protein [Flavobacterium branchiophilum]|uniref:Lipoprotein n=1 Tax=Flavobacterium branchiophilum TaxID=55197 RepID=A0A2H3KL46_9FLAO|nr:hypothetical protein [Flavobacterium branchiophilum]PDS26266.1 hypothetical protein B0A77_02850 [Flavobacterium branchiophilum]
MKKFLFLLIYFISHSLLAQKECEYSSNVKDSLGVYKATKEYLIHEHIFAGNSRFIYFYLINSDGFPSLSIQFITKNNNFTKAKCLDKNSKLYFQLQNGKIITLLAMDKEDCGTSLMDHTNTTTKILTGYFMFIQGTMEDLKQSPISFMRIKFTTETEDIVFKKTLHSDLDGIYYEPESYFINYLKCIE